MNVKFIVIKNINFRILHDFIRIMNQLYAAVNAKKKKYFPKYQNKLSHLI